jgi:Zn-dependent protease
MTWSDALFSQDVILEKVLLFFILVISISIHEWAHAFCADKLGDPLPRKEGRVTLDPMVHIDLLGTIIIPLIVIFLSPGFAILGWGKPVRVSLPNHKTRSRDDILITLAGPFSNFCLAFFAILGFGVLAQFLHLSDSLLHLLSIIVNLNCLLFLFNLLPIPPLDGSHLLKRAVGMSDSTFIKFSRYGFFLLLVLINVEAFTTFFYQTLTLLTAQFFGFFAFILG